MATDPFLLQNPIVLIHGLGARPSYGPFEYFWGIPDWLRKTGNRVLVVDLPSFHSIETRAQALRDQILQAFPQGERVNLLGHSMGGLDARYAVSKLGLAERTASVITIGTPHRGSIIGDLTVGKLPAAAYRGIESLFARSGASPEGFKQISSRYSQEVLTKDLQDQAGVTYFSAMSVIRAPLTRNALPVFWIPHEILKRTEGDNDGFVSLASATWGEHLCTYHGDHYAQIGQFLGRTRGLDHHRFFQEIIGKVKKAGF